MQCMKTRIFALAVVLATFASNASAATINIFYTGVITTVTSGSPVIRPGDPFTLSYFFDTALAAPGDYVNTGTSSLLRGSVPAVGSASFFTPGLGNLNPGSVCGGLPCTGNAQRLGDDRFNISRLDHTTDHPRWPSLLCWQRIVLQSSHSRRHHRILRAGRDWHWKRRVSFSVRSGLYG